MAASGTIAQRLVLTATTNNAPPADSRPVALDGKESVVSQSSAASKIDIPKKSDDQSILVVPVPATLGRVLVPTATNDMPVTFDGKNALTFACRWCWVEKGRVLDFKSGHEYKYIEIAFTDKKAGIQFVYQREDDNIEYKDDLNAHKQSKKDKYPKMSGSYGSVRAYTLILPKMNAQDEKYAFVVPQKIAGKVLFNFHQVSKYEVAHTAKTLGWSASNLGAGESWGLLCQPWISGKLIDEVMHKKANNMRASEFFALFLALARRLKADFCDNRRIHNDLRVGNIMLGKKEPGIAPETKEKTAFTVLLEKQELELFIIDHGLTVNVGEECYPRRIRHRESAPHEVRADGLPIIADLPLDIYRLGVIYGQALSTYKNIFKSGVFYLEFKNLSARMIFINPNERPTIEEVIQELQQLKTLAELAEQNLDAKSIQGVIFDLRLLLEFDLELRTYQPKKRLAIIKSLLPFIQLESLTAKTPCHYSILRAFLCADDSAKIIKDMDTLLALMALYPRHKRAQLLEVIGPKNIRSFVTSEDLSMLSKHLDEIPLFFYQAKSLGKLFRYFSKATELMLDENGAPNVSARHIVPGSKNNILHLKKPHPIDELWVEQLVDAKKQYAWNIYQIGYWLGQVLAEESYLPYEIFDVVRRRLQVLANSMQGDFGTLNKDFILKEMKNLTTISSVIERQNFLLNKKEQNNLDEKARGEYQAWTLDLFCSIKTYDELLEVELEITPENRQAFIDSLIYYDYLVKGKTWVLCSFPGYLDRLCQAKPYAHVYEYLKSGKHLDKVVSTSEVLIDFLKCYPPYLHQKLLHKIGEEHVTSILSEATPDDYTEIIASLAEELRGEYEVEVHADSSPVFFPETVVETASASSSASLASSSNANIAAVASSSTSSSASAEVTSSSSLSSSSSVITAALSNSAALAISAAAASSASSATSVSSALAPSSNTVIATSVSSSGLYKEDKSLKRGPSDHPEEPPTKKLRPDND